MAASHTESSTPVTASPGPASPPGSASAGLGVRSLASTLVVGLGIGTVLCVLNVLVLFKTGTSFGGSALVALLGAGLLRALGRLDWQHLFIVFSLASSGYIATAALDTGVGAVMLHSGHIPGLAVLALVAVAANACGALLGLAVARRYVVTDRLAFPTLQPAITLMTTLTRTKGQQTEGIGRVLAIASSAGAAVALFANESGHTDTPAIPGVPSYFAVALSPLLVGLGFLIGPKACAWLAIGCGYSLIVWSGQSAGSAGPVGYDQHLIYPWVLPLSVGLMLGYSAISLVRSGKPLIHALGGAGRALRSPAARRSVLLGGAGVLIAGAVGAAVLRARALHVLGLILLGAVMLAVFVLFLNRVGGEVGILPLAPVLYLSVALLSAAGLASTPAVLVAAAVCNAAVASVYYTYAVKIAHSSPDGPPATTGRVVWTQLVGGAVGGVLGIGMLVLLAHQGQIGSAGFPAPVARALNFVGTAVRGGSGYAGSIGRALAVGAPVGGLLAFSAKAMPTMLGLGVLLPPDYSLAVGIGGLARARYNRRGSGGAASAETAASGLIIGEGLALVVVLAVRLLRM